MNLTPAQASSRLAGDKTVLLDVREPWELKLAAIPGALNIPMNLLPQRIDELQRQGTILVICHTGVRSLHVANYLIQLGFEKVFNVSGGTEAWRETIDPNLASY